MKALAIALGAGLLVAVGLYLYGTSADTAKPGVVISQRAAEAAKPAPTADTAATVSPRMAPAQREQRATQRSIARLSPQSAAFFESGDLKQIVDDARKNPAAASFFYATLALRECESAYIIPLEGADNTGGPKREAMIEKVRHRCRNVAVDDSSMLRKLGDEGLAANDAGFAVAVPVSSKRQAPSVAALVDALYGRADAGVMLLVLSDLTVFSDSLQVGGRSMTETERSSLPAALLLLGCDMGIPCDDRHPLVRLECIGRGRCDALDLPTLAQRADVEYWNVYTRGTRFDYRTALALKVELADSIARGDRSALRYVATVRR